MYFGTPRPINPKKKMKKKTILKGEGVNQHTLYGNFTDINESDFMMKSDCKLVHETPSGKHAEHETLKVDKGFWVMGRQVEYNPFDKKVTRVWD